MSLLFRAKPEPVAPASGVRDTINLSQYAQLWAQSYNGFLYSVDGDTSMRHDAVWSCRTRIAQDISMLPVDVVRYVGTTRQPVESPPSVIVKPSPFVKAMNWRYQVIDSWLGWGNAWGLVPTRTGNGLYPARIDLLHPSQVTWQRVPGDRLRFYVDGREEALFPEGDLWHEPAFPTPGSPIGLSPIEHHIQKITGGLNAEKFGLDFFTAGGLPAALLTVDPPPPDQEAANKLKARLLAITSGNREPLVLPKGTEYKQMSVNPNDSQFLETQRYSVEQICRIFGEDPVDHGSAAGGSAVTYSNRLDARIARLERRQFWITKLQDALSDLIPKPQMVRLNTSATLMMTPTERHELHKLRLESKTTTINEVRRLEDEEPFPDPQYDLPGIPAAAPSTSDDTTPGGADDGHPDTPDD